MGLKNDSWDCCIDDPFASIFFYDLGDLLFATQRVSNKI